MNNNIGELFKEKNQKILFEKLLLDISNNDNSLRLIVVNRVALLSMKFQKKINEFFKNNSIEYDVESLEKIITEYKNKIIKTINEYLDKRKTNLESNINRNDEIEESDQSENEKTIILDEFGKLFNEIIYIDMVNSFSQKYKFNSQELKEEFITKYLKKFDFELSDSLVECVLERNQILKNIMKDTVEKVDKLNDITSKKFLEKK